MATSAGGEVSSELSPLGANGAHAGRRMRPNVPMTIQVANLVRVRLRKEFASGGQLPSENKLAAEMGVSRGTVRQALAVLQHEGLISRRQGQGTFANAHVLGIPARIDLACEFSELITGAGYEATIKTLDVHDMVADKDIAERLNLRLGAPLLRLTKLFLASGQPAIYAHEYLPQELIVEQYDRAELEQPLFHFIERRCHSQLKYALSELVPTVAEGEVAEQLDVAPGRPLLQFIEVFYGSRNEPLDLAIVSFCELIRFHAIRKVTQFNSSELEQYPATAAAPA